MHQYETTSRIETMDAETFKEMQELMFEKKQQLQLRNQQLDQLQRVYTQHDSGLQALDMRYRENADEGGIEEEDESLRGADYKNIRVGAALP